MPWYRQGTVAVTNGSVTVTGTGTLFSTNSRVGDAFQGPDGRWYEVTNIASSTVLSILPEYQGTTATGANYGLAPMQGYVKQSADELRAVVNQYGSTLALFGGATSADQLRVNIGAASRGANSDITSITGLTTALTVAQGGTGGTTQATARTGLGLGNAATATVVSSKSDTNVGRLLTTGYGGIGAVGANPAPSIGNMDGLTAGGLFYFSAPTNASPVGAFGTALVSSHQDGSFGCLAMSITNSKIAYRSYNASSGFSTWGELWTTANTTVDGSGFVKRASPIVRIADMVQSSRADLLESFNKSSDWGVYNEEAMGVTVSRKSKGVYIITGSAGLAKDGWQVGSPADRNGGTKLGIANGRDEDGTVVVELRKIRYALTEDGNLEQVQGDLIDVPVDAWIDVRLDMPTL